MRVIDMNGNSRWNDPRELDCRRWFWIGVGIGLVAGWTLGLLVGWGAGRGTDATDGMSVVRGRAEPSNGQECPLPGDGSAAWT